MKDNKNSFLNVFRIVLLIINVIAICYYFISAEKNNKKIRKIQTKLNNLKCDLSNITEELNDLSDEVETEIANITAKDGDVCVDEEEE